MQIFKEDLTGKPTRQEMAKDKIMSIYSKILVHWTGKDIKKSPGADRSQLYVDWLKDDLENGLYTKRTSEDAIRHKKIKNLLRICFTEIRLSQAQTHAERYGKMGIGFTRDFILKKGGRPVIYIPFATVAGGRLLEESIKKAYENSNGNEEIGKSLKWIMAHVKRMSNGEKEGSSDYEDYYEEMEWRLVQDESSTNKPFTDEGGGVHRLKFTAQDVKVIIFPDEHIKQMSLQDETIRKYFSEHLPIMATLDDCRNF